MSEFEWRIVTANYMYMYISIRTRVRDMSMYISLYARIAAFFPNRWLALLTDSAARCSLAHSLNTFHHSLHVSNTPTNTHWFDSRDFHARTEGRRLENVRTTEKHTQKCASHNSHIQKNRQTTRDLALIIYRYCQSQRQQRHIYIFV